jgi:hypothetical protein
MVLFGELILDPPQFPNDFIDHILISHQTLRGADLRHAVARNLTNIPEHRFQLGVVDMAAVPTNPSRPFRNRFEVVRPVG